MKVKFKVTSVSETKGVSENRPKLFLLIPLLSIFLIAYFTVYGIEIYTYRPLVRLVGIYYYPWYHEEAWSSLEPTIIPSLGCYMSDDEAILSQHLEWIRALGVDFIVVSWQGTENQYVDENVERIFSSMRDDGLKVCILIETWMMNDSQFEADVTHVWENYAQRKEYLRLYGKPLLMVWSVDFTNLAIQTYEDRRFTIRHAPTQVAYGHPMADSPQTLLSDFLTIIPGFDDTDNPWRQFPSKVIDRLDGETYKKQWELVLGFKALPKNLVVMICTFNEWVELTAIECSSTWGTLYLDITREFVQRFKG